jgi:SAM-dependent methyltransferase
MRGKEQASSSQSLEEVDWVQGINERLMSDAILRNELTELYRDSSFIPQSWQDRAGYAFITNRLIEISVKRFAHELRGRLIDVGCGTKPYRPYFSHATAYTSCDVIATRCQVDLICPADRIPVEAQTFDSVLCTEVLEHVLDPLSVMREFHRILTRDGRVLLTVPMFWPAHEQPWDFRRFPGHGLLHLAYASSFRVDYLAPRGGKVAMVGQVVLTAFQRYFRSRFLRRRWNETVLFLDGKTRNPLITLGWTAVLTKV